MLLVEQLALELVQGLEANVPNHPTRAAHTDLDLSQSPADAERAQSRATSQPKLPMCSSASHGALQLLLAVDLVELDQHLDHDQQLDWH